MNNVELGKYVVKKLKIEYPDAICSLQYKEPLHLLIATRLEAQCTDARVNMVTPALFERFKTVDDFANAKVEEIEEYIHSCGLYKTKAKDILNMCKMLKEEFNSIVPDSIELLTKLPGIGRKTANLILGDVYGKPAVVVDTHCIRITKRLGFHNSKNPYQVEKILKECIDENESNDFCHRLVLHGRAVCSARTPKCNKCCIKKVCKEYNFVKNTD